MMDHHGQYMTAHRAFSIVIEMFNRLPLLRDREKWNEYSVKTIQLADTFFRFSKMIFPVDGGKIKVGAVRWRPTKFNDRVNRINYPFPCATRDKWKERWGYPIILSLLLHADVSDAISFPLECIPAPPCQKKITTFGVSALTTKSIYFV